MDQGSITNELKTGRVEIYSGINSFLKKVLIAISFIAIGIILFVGPNYVEFSKFEFWFIKIAGALWLIFMIPAIAWALVRESTGSPKLILDSSGIDIQLGIRPPGLIHWNEIEGFKIKKIHSIPLLGIILKDPESAYRSSNPISRLYHKLNRRLYDASWFLSAKTLDIEFDQLVELVEEFHRANGGD